jgi:hypothetical protein
MPSPMRRGKSSACCLANKAIWIYSIARLILERVRRAKNRVVHKRRLT